MECCAAVSGVPLANGTHLHSAVVVVVVVFGASLACQRVFVYNTATFHAMHTMSLKLKVASAPDSVLRVPTTFSSRAWSATS